MSEKKFNMVKKELFDYNFQYNNELIAICSPLKKFAIDTFFYARLYSHKTFGLSTNLEWGKCWLENDIQEDNDFRTATTTAFYKNSLITTESIFRLNYVKLLHSHKCYSLVARFDNCRNYIEHYGVASSQKHTNLDTLFINDKTLFNKFLTYFKERAHDIITCGINNNIFCDSTLLLNNNKEPRSLFDDKKIDHFNKQVTLKRIPIYDESKKMYLSQRELQCLNILSQGKTVKEIAQILELSPRTVESYVTNVKMKTGYSYKSQLISFFNRKCEIKYRHLV